MPRFFHPSALNSGSEIALGESAARHVQVLRMQPGDGMRLFDGTGGEFDAQVTHMGKRSVHVQVGTRFAIEREAATPVHLLASLIANERFDWLVEKATELGVARITPLLTERAVQRLSGERASKKREHWQAIAQAACEQCGRNRVPGVDPVVEWPDWDPGQSAGDAQRLVLSLAADARPLSASACRPSVVALLGPEGGLSPAELARASQRGFAPVSLGHRVLRAETAGLALLAQLCA